MCTHSLIAVLASIELSIEWLIKAFSDSTNVFDFVVLVSKSAVLWTTWNWENVHNSCRCKTIVWVCCATVCLCQYSFVKGQSMGAKYGRTGPNMHV